MHLHKFSAGPTAGFSSRRVAPTRYRSVETLSSAADRPEGSSHLDPASDLLLPSSPSEYRDALVKKTLGCLLGGCKLQRGMVTRGVGVWGEGGGDAGAASAWVERVNHRRNDREHGISWIFVAGTHTYSN